MHVSVPLRSRTGVISRVLLFCAVCLAAFFAMGVQHAMAATYNQNLIISNDNMRATDSMTSAEIQAFLKTQTGVLKSLVTTNYAGTAETAAAIIYEACQNYDISPKVILTLLQKEQSLLTRTKLTATTLSRALGAGCPNGSTNYYPGFGKQVWYAAWLLSNYGEVKAYPSTSVALWSAGMTCTCYHDVVVTPGNLATYKLYVYNPSISGNKNFWTIHVSYFGDPVAAQFTASSASYTSAKLSWTGVSVASGYKVYRATSSDGTYDFIAKTTGKEYTDADRTTGTTYYYKVRAYYTSGSSTTYGAYTSVKSVTPVPSKTTLSSAAKDYSSVALNWTAVTGATGYEIDRATSSGGTYTAIATVTGTSYTNTKLATGITYYYKVRAYHLEGTTKVFGSFSSVTSASPVPSKVTASASSAGYTSVKLSWTSVSGATGYRVYRATSSSGTYASVATTAGTSFTNTGLATGKTYYYKVRAYCTTDTVTSYGAYSSVMSAKPVPATVSLTAASRSYTSNRLSWGSVSGASRYQVYRATSSGGTYAVIASITSTGFMDTGRTTGKTYYYKVRVYHVEGTTKVFGSFSSVKSAKPVPATVTGLKLSKASSTSVGMKWTMVPGATRYQVYRATSAGGTYTNVATVTSTSFTNTKLTAGTTYYYKVRAYHTQGSTKVYGGYSVVASETL